MASFLFSKSFFNFVTGCIAPEKRVPRKHLTKQTHLESIQSTKIKQSTTTPLQEQQQKPKELGQAFKPS